MLGDGDERAQLLYRIEPGRLVLRHTEVPESMGGRGIGGQLVRTALETARAEQLTVAPWCEFARTWLEQHPEATAGVEIDWSPPPLR